MTSSQPHPTHQGEGRVTFRRRLLIAQGLVLAVAFSVIGVLGWLGTYGWLHYHAWTLLESEADDIAFHIAGPNGLLTANYSWNEPHHRFSEARVDPYFVQVFDNSGRLVYASENTRHFRGTYPDTLLSQEASAISTFSALNSRRIEGRLLYFGTYPVVSARGQRLGALQLARYNPDIPSTLTDIAVGLSVGLFVLLMLLLVLTDRVARRTLAPLQSITRVADALSPTRMDARIPVPADADWETARLADTLNALLARLEGAFENMRRFTSNAAHELQTPLTVLRGHVDVSLRRPREPEAYRKTLHLLGAQIDSMSRTIRSLLTLARLERDRSVLPNAVFDLSQLILEETPPYALRAHDAGLGWIEDIDAGTRVLGLPDLLRDVARNLLDNAVKFTVKGEIRVGLKTHPAGDRVTLTVTDTGIGIEPEALPFVTERFFRATTGIDAASGRGLGLSLVEQIVDLHGGYLEIDSTPGAGTTVHIILPTVSGPGNAAADTPSVPAVTQTAAPGR